MPPGFGGGNGMYTEINPEDLFNAFFGGGMGGGFGRQQNGKPSLVLLSTVS
jgi:DnaJ family protein B protein 12